ncbi:hypothetical protein M0R45_036558 [Rubus argutus]|uniref:Uncharacterized protein n=1 Tax=Rubus argutus TaxID=59490 RepID=A0AAW1VZ67_RUBAR
MNVLGVNNQSPKQSKRSKASKDELTGRDSDAERFMETTVVTIRMFMSFLMSSNSRLRRIMTIVDSLNHQIPFSNSIYDFPNFSDSLFEPFAGHFEVDVLSSFDQI